MVITPRFVFLCFAATLCGCESFLHPSCAGGTRNADAIVVESERQTPGTTQKWSKESHIPFPYDLHPRIPRITLSSGKGLSLDGIEYQSMDAILKEFKKRSAEIGVTGVYCNAADKRSDEINWEAYRALFEYCKTNDIDMFYSFAMGLPPLDNLLNVHCVLQSSETEYELPNDAQNECAPDA